MLIAQLNMSFCGWPQAVDMKSNCTSVYSIYIEQVRESELRQNYSARYQANYHQELVRTRQHTCINNCNFAAAQKLQLLDQHCKPVGRGSLPGGPRPRLGIEIFFDASHVSQSMKRYQV